MSRVASMAIARSAMQLRASASHYPEAGLASAILSLRLAQLPLWRVQSSFDKVVSVISYQKIPD
jgi:hypothetical protein